MSPIGAGGMGEVYRARDTRLDRTVAIKILPAALAQNTQLKLRFEREARAISSLAHPHICTLHDVGSDSGVDFIVMEHLEGETLADRIERGALPLEEAIRHAIEIADALDKAHRHGIVHRDLKPANVMLTRTGAKLLDFGLARSVETETINPDSATIMAPATREKPLTSEGTLVGTFQYMAPEQLDGRTADARTDIFAFGAVLYEMLTGKRAFDGKSRASVIASIIAAEPQPIRTLRPLTPSELDRVVSICLRKDPDERWQSAWDLKLELEALLAMSSRTEEQARTRRGSASGWIAAALVLLSGAGLAIWDRTANHRPASKLVVDLAPPAGATFNATDAPAAISPDGTLVAHGLVGGPGDGLYVRSLASGETRQLRGVETGYDAFWSPDSRELGFFANGKLRRINIATGAISTIAEVGDGRGATWGAGNVILYAPSVRSPIYRIAPEGGTPTAVTKLDASRKETGHWRPSFLPDGKRFLFMALSADPDQAGVYLGSLESPDVQKVLNVLAPSFFHDGHLFYYNQDNVYAVALDPDTGRTSGEAMLVARNVAFTGQFAVAAVSISRNGVLIYNSLGSSPATSVHRVELEGGAAESLKATGVNVDVSPDGNFVAYMYVADQNRNNDLWIHDLRRNVSSRMTFDPREEGGPVWSPDAKTLAYSLQTQEGIEIWLRNIAGSEAKKLLDAHEFGMEVVDWSPDGATLLAERGSVENRTDMVLVDVSSGRITPFAALPFREASGRFSADGGWIAYTSDETGANEVYVQPFPPDGTKAQVTNGGGDSPRWNGRTLLYVDRSLALMAVDVAKGDGGFTMSAPRRVTQLSTADYDVLPGGKAVIASRRDDPQAMPIVVKTDWRSR